MNFKKIEKMMLSGEIYDPQEKALMKVQIPRIEQVHLYNQTPSTRGGFKERRRILDRNFKKVGKNCYIEPPFYANLGGMNVTIGDNFYSNFGLTMVDDGEIEIGDNVMIGPNCTLVTANHPICPDLREKGIQFNKKITLKDGVWLGASVIVLPGVTIGKNSIIGAGSLVNKDIPDNVIAFGNPAQVYRAIAKIDYEYYDHNKPIPSEFLKMIKK